MHALRNRIAIFSAMAVALASAAWSQEGPPVVRIKSAADYMPAEVVAAATLRDGGQHLAELREFIEARGLAEEGPLADLLEKPELAQARVMLLGLAAAAGTDLWELAGDLLGRELVVGLAPRPGGEPLVCMAILLDDGERVRRFLDGVYTLTGHRRGAEFDADRSHELAGVRIYHFGERLFQAIRDDVLLLSNDRAAIERIVGHGAPADDRLASDGDYMRVRRDVPGDAPVWAFVRVARLRALAAEKRPLPERLDNPLAAYLFGGLWQGVQNAEAGVAWLGFEGERVTLAARVRPVGELPESHRGFAPPPVPASWEATELAGYLADVSVPRDWAALFAEREQVLTLAGASQIVNFSTTMSTLLGGLDFMNDVLPALEGPTRLILTRQDFAGRNPIPVPKLPAFALVTALKESEVARLSQRLSTGLQMAVSILNLENAQQGNPTYVIDVDRYEGVRYFFTDFALDGAAGSMGMPADGGGMSGSSSADEAPAPTSTAAQETAPDSRPAPAEGGVRFNFRPAAAVVGRELVVATSAELLREIISAATRAAAAGDAERPAPAPLDRLRLDGAALAGLLRENRRELVVNKVLEGASQAAAESEIDVLLGLLDLAAGLRVDVQRTPDDLRGELELRFDWSGPAAGGASRSRELGGARP